MTATAKVCYRYGFYGAARKTKATHIIVEVLKYAVLLHPGGEFLLPPVLYVRLGHQK